MKKRHRAEPDNPKTERALPLEVFNGRQFALVWLSSAQSIDGVLEILHDVVDGIDESGHVQTNTPEAHAAAEKEFFAEIRRSGEPRHTLELEIWEMKKAGSTP